MNFPEIYSKQREQIRTQLGQSWSSYSEDLDLLLHLKWLGFQPRAIYDIGSSNSVWSVMANLIYPQARFEMFEPLAEISHSYRTAKHNNVPIAEFIENTKNEIHPVALGAKSGTCPFQWQEGDEVSSSSLRVEKRKSDAKVVEVPIYRLDDYVDARNLEPPDLIKLDTQGSEMEIFAGAGKALRSAKVIFIECWLSRQYGPNTPLFLEIANHLFAAGFDLFAIGDEYRGGDGVAQSKDAVFIRRDISLNPDPALEAPFDA